VDFRRIPGWSCLIFELGDAFSTSPKNLRPYTATIAGQTISLPGHWWGSRWRWQSGPWPLPMVPVDDLFARKLLPVFDASVTQGTSRPMGPAAYKPLELAGLTGYMPMTGERSDIGFLTEWQADYVCMRTPQALASVLAQGEAGATIPWRYYDPKTGTTLDAIIGYPHAPDNPQIAGEPATLPRSLTTSSSSSLFDRPDKSGGTDTPRLNRGASRRRKQKISPSPRFCPGYFRRQQPTDLARRYRFWPFPLLDTRVT
jgi:hypothetical protein